MWVTVENLGKKSTIALEKKCTVLQSSHSMCTDLIAKDLQMKSF